MKLSELRGKLASEWQNKGCVDGLMVFENVRTRWAATDFSEGFDAGAKAVMEEATELVRAAKFMLRFPEDTVSAQDLSEALARWTAFKEGNDEPG